MSDEQVWTLAKVKQWLREHGASGDTDLAIVLASDIVFDYEQERATLTAQVATLMKGNEYMQEKIMELEAELAQAQAGGRWLPVEDGDYSGGCVVVEEAGKRLCVLYGDGDYNEAWATDVLPDNIRLCRWQEGSES